MKWQLLAVVALVTVVAGLPIVEPTLAPAKREPAPQV